MKHIEELRFSWRVAIQVLTATLICACAQTSYPHPDPLKVYTVADWVPDFSPKPPPLPIAKPQVVYRIDENRYFEIVPRSPAACERALVYYVDKKLEIYSYVIPYDAETMNGRKFRIDAANDRYLGAPTSRLNIECTGRESRYCKNLVTAFSVNFGRSWEFVDIPAIGNQTITKSFYFDTAMMDKSIEFRSPTQIETGKFFDMTTPYKYYHQVWLPTNSNVTNKKWQISDYTGRQEFCGRVCFAIFANEFAPKIDAAPPLIKEPLDDEFKCNERALISKTVKNAQE